MKRYLCILLLFFIILSLSSCSQEAGVREMISAMYASESKNAPAGKIYLSDATLGDDEYISPSLCLAVFGEHYESDPIDSFAVRLSLSECMYEYAVVKAKTIDGTDEIVKMLAKRIDDAHVLAHKLGCDSYIRTADSAKIYVIGKYVFLLMTDDNEGMLTAAKKVIN